MLNLISLFGVQYWRIEPQCNIKIGFPHPPDTQLYSPVIHKSSVYIQLQFKCARSSLCPAVKRKVSSWKQIILPRQTNSEGLTFRIWYKSSYLVRLLTGQICWLFVFSWPTNQFTRVLVLSSQGVGNNLYWASTMCEVLKTWVSLNLKNPMCKWR